MRNASAASVGDSCVCGSAVVGFVVMASSLVVGGVERPRLERGGDGVEAPAPYRAPRVPQRRLSDFPTDGMLAQPANIPSPYRQ